MMEDPSDDPPPEDYAVGYGRPPKATRFKPGSSGNPKGRPQKTKTVDAMLEEALARRVTIEEHGHRKKISTKEVIVRRLVGKAAKGDLKAIQLLLLQLKERCESSPGERRLSAVEEAAAQRSQYAQHAALARMSEAEREEFEAPYIALLAERPPPDDGQTNLEESIDRYLAFLRDGRR